MRFVTALALLALGAPAFAQTFPGELVELGDLSFELRDLRLGELDGDGRADVIVVSSDEDHPLLGTGNLEVLLSEAPSPVVAPSPKTSGWGTASPAESTFVSRRSTTSMYSSDPSV